MCQAKRVKAEVKKIIGEAEEDLRMAFREDTEDEAMSLNKSRPLRNLPRNKEHLDKTSEKSKE